MSREPKRQTGIVRPETVNKVLEFCKDIFIMSPELVASKERRTTYLVAKYGISAGVPAMLREEGIISEKIENGTHVRTWSNGEPSEELVTRWMIKYNHQSWQKYAKRKGIDPDRSPNGPDSGVNEGARYVRIEAQDVNRTIEDMTYLMDVAVRHQISVDKIPGFCKEIMGHFLTRK